MTSPPRPVILTLMGSFWPDSASSGAVSSLKGLMRALAGDFEFRIVARDRPFGAPAAVAERGRWLDLDFACVRYCRPSPLGAIDLGEILRSTAHDALLLNGFFDRDLTIPALIMRRIGKTPARPAILSPRGEFADGSLALKGFQKGVYLRFASSLGLLRDVWLHATAEHEAEDIRRRFSACRGVVLAPDSPRFIDFKVPALEKAPSAPELRLAFAGRVTPVKNLDYALDVLRLVTADVEFDIYGPIEDGAYWAKCEQSISRMPSNIRVRYRGEIANDRMPLTLMGYDLFFLPSRGENFGHAIYEALASGVPVLIGDRTMWRDLDKAEAGWSLPLSEPGRFAAVIDRYSRSHAPERQRLRAGARRLADTFFYESDFAGKYRAMFWTIMREGVR